MWEIILFMEIVTLAANLNWRKMIQHFWQWYISLFTSDDSKLVVAAWAATLATITFLLNFVFKPIYLYWKKKSAELKVELG